MTIAMIAKKLNSYRGRFVLAMISAAILLILFIVLAIHPPDPVPPAVLKSVSYSVYYTNPNQLPPGFSLNPKTFEALKPNVVIFSVSDGQKDNIVLSEQAAPSSHTITDFINHYIPLHNQTNVNLGQATIGAYNNRGVIKSVFSLVVDNKTWIIGTAPDNISQADLIQIINSLTKAD